ncbi:hypothetical protein [Sphingobium yanoikuyae]|uniref:hypothetical protein n=1 Tax=Sphingobium yanoikuyae TaxID=13690 RepID=UPI000262C01F|nr:hypothetical protein [Sphingobium yanoikuyae]
MTTKPNEPEGLVTLPEAARDLIRAMHDDQAKVGYRLDLWNVLQACLDAPTHPVADAGGVTEDDVIGLINIVTDLAEVDALDKAYPEVWGRLDAMVNHAVAAATAGMPTIWEDPAGKGYPCFERPMTPAEARDTIDHYGREIARLQEALTAIAEQEEHEIALDPDWPRRIARATLSEAREAGE